MTEPPPPPDAGGPDWGQMKDKISVAGLNDKIILGAGVLYLVDSFLPWGKISFGLSGFGGIERNFSGWNSGGLAVISILFALAALALAVAKVAGVNLNVPEGTVYLACGGGALLFALLRMVTWPTGIGSAFGIFLAVLLGAALTYAGYMKYQSAKKTV